MAILANQRVYVGLNTVDVSEHWVSLTLTETAAPIDVTGGANPQTVERAPGLLRARVLLTLRYDTEDLPVYGAQMRPGQPITLVYGAEGSAAGKPSFTGVFFVTQVSHTRAVDKSAVTFDLVLESAGAFSVGEF